MHKLGIAIVVLVVLTPGRPSAAAPASAPASTPAAGGAKELARAAYVRARAHYEAGKYAEAVAELKAAYAKVRFSALLRYIGDSYYAMKRYQLALKYYRLYLRRARYAQDKIKVGRRVRELEESLSVDEGASVGGGVQAKLPPELIPDGKDAEVPDELLPPAPPASAPATQPPTSGGLDPETRATILRAAKWSALGISVAALAVGITFNALARSEARELEEAVRTACPEHAPDCGGNPDLLHPVSAFSPAQYDLEQTYLRYQNRSIGFFVGAGVAAAAAVVLFVLDRPAGGEGRISAAPVIGAGRWAVAGEVRF